jgi:hypothetical protein
MDALIRTEPSTGRIESAAQQALVTLIDEYIKSVHVRVDDAVTAGPSIVTMDDTHRLPIVTAGHNDTWSSMLYFCLSSSVMGTISRYISLN